MGWEVRPVGCNCRRRSRTRTSCPRECCGRISSGRVRSKRSGNERRAKWKRFCWKARCAIASGTRRGRRRNWGFRQRRSWRSCGERGWRSKAGKAELKPGLYKSLRANGCVESDRAEGPDDIVDRLVADGGHEGDRKSTRLNSSHSQISYAVFCLKKKNKNESDRASAATSKWIGYEQK